jgi:hypothetical protein
MKKTVSAVAIPDRLGHGCGIRGPMDGFIGGPPKAVSGMAAGDTGPKLPYTAIFNRAQRISQ